MGCHVTLPGYWSEERLLEVLRYVRDGAALRLPLSATEGPDLVGHGLVVMDPLRLTRRGESLLAEMERKREVVPHG